MSAAIDIELAPPFDFSRGSNPVHSDPRVAEKPAVMRLALNHGHPNGGESHLLQEFGGAAHFPGKRDRLVRKRLGY